MTHDCLAHCMQVPPSLEDGVRSRVKNGECTFEAVLLSEHMRLQVIAVDCR
jgi:hypothetical protein